MSKYTIEVISYKEVPKSGAYSFGENEKKYVTKAELYEAISVYLRTKGFTTEIVAVEVKETTTKQ